MARHITDLKYRELKYRNFALTVANFTPYSIDSSDDQLEDAIATLNRLIDEAKTLVDI